MARKGDIEGLGTVYDRNGNLILQKGEEIILYLPNTNFNLTFIEGKDYQEEIYSYISTKNEPKLSTTFITNKRIIWIRPPSPSKLGIFSYGTAIAPAYDSYYNEVQAYEKGAMIFREINLNEISMEIWGNSIWIYNRNNKKTLGCISHLKLLGTSKIIKFLEENNIPYSFVSSSAKYLFIDIFNRFKFGDIEGLNTIYDINGNPILENDEYIISQVMTSPFVMYESFVEMKSSIGYLFKTNKRLIFIRNITNEDEIYYPLHQATHIYFWFNPNDSNKIETKGNNLVFEFSSTKRKLLWRTKVSIAVLFPINEIRGILGEYL